MWVRGRLVWAGAPLLVAAALLRFTVPTEVQQPGTQPNEVANLGSVTNCDNCHGGYDPSVEPAFNWRGSMMAHASRDPLFWATMAVAEQDFPGVGDLCLRCHTTRAWLEGRSTPTDGSAVTGADVDGIECAICHKLVNPDDSEHLGTQNPPFLAHNEASPKEGYYGSGMMVLWDGKERMGPYDDSVARHPSLQSAFHRSEDFCGTCHDVSNPVVGDLAHNHGAAIPLPVGSFSGVLGAPVDQKAAFNNPPFAYGVVERTFSEHKTSAWPGLSVGSYSRLSWQLQRGAVRRAFEFATAAGGNGDYADGSPRFFTCQSCHMPPVQGAGCNKSNSPIRPDLPLHDLTGGNYWVPDLIRWLDARGRLVVGGGLSVGQTDALGVGQQRARQQLELAAAVSVEGDTVVVYNLTGHKLISGYPEGRRMWLRVRWLDDRGRQLRVDGEYGALQVQIGGSPATVESLIDLRGTDTRIYQAKPGMTSEWAARLLALGVKPSLPLVFDRVSGAVTLTLAQLAALPAGSARETFHFALNNTLLSDNRIPPYGMRYDEAQRRNCLPVPATQFGDPGPGGVFEHHDEVMLNPPAEAVYATVELLYQPTSWEYVQFLHLANDGSVAFLARTGQDLLDGWRNTGMAGPHVMTVGTWCRLAGTGEDFELESQVNGHGDPGACGKTAVAGDAVSLRWSSPGGRFVGALSALLIQLHPFGTPPVALATLPGLHLGGVDAQVAAALPAAGVALSISAPAVSGWSARVQAVVLSPAAANGVYATTDAHEVAFRSR